MTILTQIDFPILCVGVGVDVARVDQFRNGVINGYEGLSIWKFGEMPNQLAFNKGFEVGTRLKEYYHES